MSAITNTNNNKNLDIQKQKNTQPKNPQQEENNEITIKLAGNGCKVGDGFVCDADSYNSFDYNLAREIDDNGDGKVSQEEFDKCFSKEKFDINGDGKISQEEEKARNSYHSLLNTQFIFKKMDTDGDGKISNEEEDNFFKQNDDENHKLLANNKEKVEEIVLKEGQTLELTGHSIEVDRLILLKRRENTLNLKPEISGNTSKIGRIYKPESSSDNNSVISTPQITGNSVTQDGILIYGAESLIEDAKNPKAFDFNNDGILSDTELKVLAQYTYDPATWDSQKNNKKTKPVAQKENPTKKP